MGVRLIGQSEAHTSVLSLLERVAPTDAEILITGSSGVGKELYATYAHEKSGRRAGALVTINCGALPPELFENELFGHASGAYTGASGRSDGLVSDAERGTLFLDEVDTLVPQNQAKLLRFIQSKEYRRLGERCVRRADVRFIAATNADLLENVSSGRFREDLFFRLRVVPVRVPTLQERQSDIPLLVDDFASTYATKYGVPRIVVPDDVLQKLVEYSWPGNVRELENCVRYLTCLQLTRPVQVADLPLIALRPKQTIPLGDFQKLKSELVSEFERSYVEQALEQSQGNIAHAARASGKARRAFFELMRKHGVRAERT